MSNHLHLDLFPFSHLLQILSFLAESKTRRPLVGALPVENLCSLSTDFLDMVVKHIQRKLDEKSEKHSEDLRKLGLIASELQLSSNVIVLPQTPQFVGINTILQNPETEQVDFVFYFDRLASMLIER